jgi:hypothetical protein
VAREIERTAVWLSKAGASVPRARNARADGLLASAVEFQSDARSAYEVQHYARAQRLTQAAREYAERAMRLVGPAKDDPENVKAALDRTDDALGRLKDYVKTGRGSAASRGYEDLRDRQKAAHERFGNGDVRGAYSATILVREGVLKLIQDPRPSRSAISRETAERAVKSAERSREKAGEDIGPKPGREASRFLLLADQQLARARAFLARNNPTEALLRAKAAERQLERAIDAARPAQAAR